jgi:RNA polymerase sigma-70 factor (ECF subfamily)
MNTTSITLLERLRRPGEHDAWPRFVRLYTPLLYSWARRLGLPAADAADLVQDVLLVLVQKLPEFSYDPRKSFRGWLRTIALNKYRERCRRPTTLPLEANGAGEPTTDDGAAAFEEAEYHRHLVQSALKVMHAEFEPATLTACWEFVVSGRPAAQVAAELGVSVDVVYGAKSRVLRPLRQELDGLLD